ncbi:MAG: prolipoprotein diacylglyceryl transferase [Myxococcota bacterium]|nr:prolipoprotein diacylglyceryl transferase [Myxococcota bacterium]
MDHGIVFNLDPTIVRLGPLQLRYYGIIFATMLYIGFIIWRRQMLRGGYAVEIAEKFLMWGVIAVLAGARLGHCLFYEPERFLKDPITILYVWKGGLASHGATIGLVIALVWFARRYKVPIIEVLDRFSMSAAVGAASVRLGNFFNSEIVGRETDVPWAVRFVRYDGGGVARHPSQLYEFFFGLLVLATLYLVDRIAGREKRPRGLLAGTFLVLYFLGRFLIEFVKEYQVDRLIEKESFLTMGQYLSILPFLCGVAMLVWAFKKGAPPEPSADKQPAPKVPVAAVKRRRGKKRRK